MKQCKKCGTLIDNNDGDFCQKCISEGALTIHEKWLSFFSKFFLIGGILATIIMAFTLVVVEEDYYGVYDYHSTVRKFSLSGFIITLSTFLSSLLSWAFLSCIVKMSVNTRTMIYKREQKN